MNFVRENSRESSPNIREKSKSMEKSRRIFICLKKIAGMMSVQQIPSLNRSHCDQLHLLGWLAATVT